jgi:hypothetical protein
MIRNCMLLGLAALAGCAGAPVKAEPSAVDAPGIISLAVRTASKGGPGWQAVPPGAQLHSGTEFALNITAGTAAFIYVGQHPAGGEISLIYPAAESQGVRADPSHSAYLPADGQWFQLDEHPGEETLLLLASTHPQDARTARQLLTERGDQACVKLRDPPPEIPVRDRGEGVKATLGEDGLAVLCFPFHHN